MYAVIQTGGKQYRVQEGDVLRVASLSAEAGKKVNFDHVLLIGEGDAIKTGADAARSSVAAEILEHGRGKKVEIFKKRRRKHSQRTQGHRQDYTAVRITRIATAKAVPEMKTETKSAGSESAEKKPATAANQSEEKVVSAKKVTAKPVASKASAAKKTAKPAAKKASVSAAGKTAAKSKE